ncbi:MAG TPA: alpha/beta hydrolase [Candidatus Limnocylindrales bacterium]
MPAGTTERRRNAFGIRRTTRSAPRLAAIAIGVIVFAAGCGTSPTPPASPGATAIGGSDLPPANGTSPSGSGTVASPAATAPTPAAAHWTDCGGGFQCATVSVPTDYANPGAASLNVSIVRLPASDPSERIGSLFVNPGGPGESGVDFVREAVDVFPRSLLKRFDLVGFDPRGVNFSTPIRCVDNLDNHLSLDPSPDTPAELEALVADARSFAADCAARNGNALAHVSTEDVARDLDQLRIAVGDEKLTYLGFSYGTLIGATYADLFPTRIRAMALDGAVDPALTLPEVRAGQAAGFETALDHFLADCAQRTSCLFHEGGQTRPAFDRLMARIDAHPLPATRSGDRRTVGPGLAWGAVLGSLYSDATWSGLDVALALAARGDGSGFLAMSDPFHGRNKNGSYLNQIDAYAANTCLDYPASHDVGSYTALANRVRPKAPDFADYAAYNDLVCAFWPTPATRTPHAVAAVGAPPIVVVGTTGDPATPYAWAKSLATELRTGVLVTHRGEGHTSFLVSSCVRRALEAYLTSVEPPPIGTSCD